MLAVFTDGSAVESNPGPSGSAYIVMRKGKLLCGRGFSTGRGSNNRSELIAAVHGLKAALGFCAKGEDVLLVSDSTYLLQGLAKCSSCTRSGVPNHEQWRRLHGLLRLYAKNRSHCLLYWVRGHNGTNGNMLCDHMANKAATDGLDYVPVQKPRNA